jgi:hypothetical protein
MTHIAIQENEGGKERGLDGAKFINKAISNNRALAGSLDMTPGSTPSTVYAR